MCLEANLKRNCGLFHLSAFWAVSLSASACRRSFKEIIVLISSQAHSGYESHPVLAGLWAAGMQPPSPPGRRSDRRRRPLMLQMNGLPLSRVSLLEETSSD
ncbi:hypothetical protein CC85DRAFT_5345 [Cutaneotrichosporon oleaginosum]|uniref:Uncharacterized protein n=1 Tax=Cutaneotrichosporon oleaginosum TaxID=879819 RepID=A0A0J0XZR5_9TREE|nr:uncharacterized protein CC85DRAFT_5345 [Cutaneotrichosporon oleaginosum]KLT46545.1 hypothetical protein CC85DRAFT_5345 [Cutaneotrichosporon oleaginosum]TXT15088.1 hypothetical protein COLE_01281 [Cutaneotrichosporon oleaginosum]